MASDIPVPVPVTAPAETFAYRIGETVGTFWRELNEQGHKPRRWGAAAVAATTQVIERGRAMALVLPIAFDETLTFAAEQGYKGWETAGLAGGVVGGVFGAWSWGVGKTFHVAVDQFPETTQTTVENHPVMVGVIKDAVGGFPDTRLLDVAETKNDPDASIDLGPYAASESVIGKAGLAVGRGLRAGFLFGETAYVGVAKVLGYSRQRINQLRAAVTVESGLVLGGVGAGVSGLVTNNFMGAAETVRDTITDKRVLFGVQAGLIGVSALSNWSSRRAYARDNLHASEFQVAQDSHFSEHPRIAPDDEVA